MSSRDIKSTTRRGNFEFKVYVKIVKGGGWSE